MSWSSSGAEGDNGLEGLGGGTGGSGFTVGFGGGKGGIFSACLVGGMRAILEAEAGGDIGGGLVVGGRTGFRMDCLIW